MTAVPMHATAEATAVKALRESMKPGVIALLIVSVGQLFSLGVQHLTMSGGIDTAASSGVALSLFTLTSALAALIVGRAQISHENRGDRWAFLTHRPVTRSTIFWTKAAAGISVYVGAAGLPLLCATIWLATPGHRPVPFDLRLALPGIADLLCGVVFYFAALLISMRQAKWLGSRALPIGAALACSGTVLGVSSFWGAMAVIAVGCLIVATAARATFLAGGSYEPASPVGRAATGVATGAGLQIAGTIALGAVGLMVATSKLRSFRTTDYVLDANGEVVRAQSVYRPFAGFREVIGVTDVEGRPLPQYADSIARSKLTAGVVSTAGIPLDLHGRYASAFGAGYRGSNDVFVQLGLSRTVQPTTMRSAQSWYYLRRLGLIAGYDNSSAEFIGWIGPAGFTTGQRPPADRFEGPLDPYSDVEYRQPLLAFPGAVYRFDLAHRSIDKIFTPPSGDTVIAAAASDDTASAMNPLAPRGHFNAIVTTKAVYVQSSTGTPPLAVARDPLAVGYGTVTVARALLAPGSPTFLWYRPDHGTPIPYRFQSAARGARVDKFVGDNTPVARITLPADTASSEESVGWAETISSGLWTPVTERLVTTAYAKVRGVQGNEAGPSRPLDVAGWLLSVFASLASGAIAVALSRTYAFDRKRTQLWAVLGFALGALGLLLMLSLIERPAREPCLVCGRPRVVTRDRCEHCDASFPATTAEGTEIFETVGTRLLSEPASVTL